MTCHFDRRIVDLCRATRSHSKTGRNARRCTRRAYALGCVGKGNAVTLQILVLDGDAGLRTQICAHLSNIGMTARGVGDARQLDQALADPSAAIVVCRSEEHTSELQSLMRTSYAVFCLKKKTPSLHNNSSYHS